MTPGWKDDVDPCCLPSPAIERMKFLPKIRVWLRHPTTGRGLRKTHASLTTISSSGLSCSLAMPQIPIGANGYLLVGRPLLQDGNPSFPIAEAAPDGGQSTPALGEGDQWWLCRTVEGRVLHADQPLISRRSLVVQDGRGACHLMLSSL